MYKNYIYIISIISLINCIQASLITPSNNAILNYTHVLFEWEQENDAVSYNLQLSTDNIFSNLLSDITNESLININISNIIWDSNYYWRVRPIYQNDTYGDWIDSYSFSTGSQRSEAYSINTDNSSYQDGVTIFSSFFNYYSAMMDQYGNEIWNTGSNDIVYYNTDYYGQLFGCYVNNDLENYLPGIEFSIDNEYIWEEPNNEFLHHELIQLPNGNYIGLVETMQLGPIPEGPWTPLYQTLGYEADGETDEFPWIGDKIVIWDQHTNDIVWEWDSFDYFNMLDYDTIGSTWFEGFSNGRYDWTHANALQPEVDNEGNLNKIYLSSRHLSRITKIDYLTKDIDWNMGLDLPSGDIDCGQDISFSWQHSLTVSNGNIITFDNGNLSTSLLNTDYPTSRGLEINIIGENDQCESTEIIWEYSLPENYFGFASGNVQKLENGNYLIVTVGDGGTALEVNANNEHIWEGKFNLQLPNGAVYRANRISGLYPIAYSIVVDDMHTDSGTNYIDINSPNLNFNIYNDGNLDETYDIYIILDNNENYLESINLNTNESSNILFEHNNSDVATIKIIPRNRNDLEKNITIYLNGCTDPIDCSGVCGGSAIEDCNGVCGGSAIEDCSGICEGNSTEDCNGVCNGSAVVDCYGICGGGAVIDECGICNGDGIPCNNCGDGYTLYENIPNSTIVLDGSSCFNNIDLSALDDILVANSIDVESPIHLGTQNWSNGRVTRLEAGNYYQGGLVTLTTIPESINNMSNMSVLYFNYNELTQLPNSITNLNNLIYLVLSFNQLSILPEDIGNLNNLIWLDLGYNELEFIPESIGNLQNLYYLWIFNNNLTEIPESICNLNINWDSDDPLFLPYFGAGGNQLCGDLPDCIENSSNLNSSIDPLYYSFEITIEQDCTEQCSTMDINNDGIVNVIDIVSTVNIILGTTTPDDYQSCAADVNDDGLINVIDIVSIVNFILN